MKQKSGLDIFLESLEDIQEDQAVTDIPADVEFLDKQDANGNELIRIIFLDRTGTEVTVDGYVKIDSNTLKQVRA